MRSINSTINSRINISLAIVFISIISAIQPCFSECEFDWKPVDSGTDEWVSTLTVYNGELIAGGQFTIAGGVDANHIARWDSSSWQPLANGITGGYYGPDYTEVLALTVYNEELIAGGDFNTAGDVDANCIARWDGSDWQSFGNDIIGTGYLGGYPIVYALTVYDDELVVGGRFVSIGGVSASMIARWDDSSWYPLGSGMSVASEFEGSPDVYALTVYDGELIVGGAFLKAGGIDVNMIARWNGSIWQPLGSGMNDTVNSLAVYNGKLIAGGDFTIVGGVGANKVARWDGSSWQPLGSGMNINSVEALAVYNGELIAGGGFTTAGGVSASRIARWDGSDWQPLDSGMNSWVHTLMVYNGELIAGGPFTIAGSVDAQYCARWGKASVYKGDLNHDCVVDWYDVDWFVNNWLGQDCLQTGWCYEADLNYDGDVDFSDYAELAFHWLAGD